MKKKLISVLSVVFLLAMLLATASAAYTPYGTYTYSISGEALPSPAAYSAQYYINDQAMSTTALKVEIGTNVLSDLCTDARGWVYVVDTKGNRVIALNRDYKAQYVIESFHSDKGRNDTFSKPTGIYASDEYLYVCDTGNQRIVMFNFDGSYHKTVNAPQSAYFGESSVFSPIACAADRYGRLFVISSDENQGVIVMTEDSEFTGFIGAQKVTYSLWDIFFRRFQSEEERESSLKNTAINLTNIALQHGTYGDFVYTVTDSSQIASGQEQAIKSKEATYSPVKKLNANGDEILKRNGFFDCAGEVDISSYSRSSSKSGVSVVRDVAVGPEGSWSIIDSKRSKVFTYDSNGQLLYAFGDNNDQHQMGNVKKLYALDYQFYSEDLNGDGVIESTEGTYNLLLLDYEKHTFTVFSRTEYGDLLIQALRNDNNRNYSASLKDWESILEANNNFDAAYIGIGKAYYNQGEYDLAMEYLSAAKETEFYATTLAEKNQEKMAASPLNLILIVAAVIVVVILIVKFLGYAKRLNYAGNFKHEHTYWEEIMYCFYVMFHPFDGFWDIKHEKRGTVRGGLTILAFTALAFFYQVIGRSYLANPTGQYSGLLVQVTAIFVPVLLWAVSNWCLTTLFDGEASFRDVFVSSCYAVAPLPWFIILSTVLTNVTNNGGAELTGLVTGFGFVWVAFLLFFGTLTVQDYSLGKNVITTIGTIVCMIVIMFVIILFASLVGDMASFISNLITEISYRA